MHHLRRTWWWADICDAKPVLQKMTRVRRKTDLTWMSDKNENSDVSFYLNAPLICYFVLSRNSLNTSKNIFLSNLKICESNYIFVFPWILLDRMRTVSHIINELRADLDWANGKWEEMERKQFLIQQRVMSDKPHFSHFPQTTQFLIMENRTVFR